MQEYYIHIYRSNRLDVYMHKSDQIPRLSFDGYFKIDKPFVTGNVSSKVTIYCVKIKDINTKSEGKIPSCPGSLTVNSDVYRTVWIATNERHYNFVNEAWLKLFDVDSKDDTRIV
jgi:hypothetical protein